MIDALPHPITMQIAEQMSDSDRLEVEPVIVSYRLVEGLVLSVFVLGTDGEYHAIAETEDGDGYQKLGSGTREDAMDMAEACADRVGYVVEVSGDEEEGQNHE